MEPATTPTGAPIAARRISYVLVNVVALALALFCVFVVLWAREGIEFAARGRERDMAVRAVLAPAFSEYQALELVKKLKEATPGLDISFIRRSEARSLLALQEPWMKNLPEIEIGDLPAILEIHHPALLKSRRTIEAFNESLAQEPGVQFVMFNSTGYDQLIRFAAAVRSYAKFLGLALGSAATALYVLCNLLSARLKMSRSLGAAIGFATVNFTLGLGLAGLFLRGAQIVAARRYPTLPGPDLLSVAACGLGAFALCLLLELKDVRPSKKRIVRKRVS